MPYKVFLVEDEIVTRDGIRDNVDWESVGFKFCGEAADGEMALPLIEDAKPDVLITDIKMPFMDGLQLSRIIREHMPWVKIIILSGHNEFDYAQSAIKLGVTEYLLKPVSATDIQDVLVTIGATLRKEHKEQEHLKQLQQSVEGNLVLQREQFILRLVAGGVPSADAIDQSQRFGLNIVAKHYLVMLMVIELCEKNKPFDYHEYRQVERIVSDLAANNPDVLMTKKDVEEIVLLMKGDSHNQLIEEAQFLAEQAKKNVEEQTQCGLSVEIGPPQDRLGDIHRSFAAALVRIKRPLAEAVPQKFESADEKIELRNIDKATIDNYIRFGSLDDFDEFFAECLQPIKKAIQNSHLIRHYFIVDMLLTIAQFVSDLGGEVNQIVPEVANLEQFLEGIVSVDQIKQHMKDIFTKAFALRNARTNHERLILIQQAKEYIDNNFMDPTLQLKKVAAMQNLSPSHFSSVFHEEVGETFRDYLSKLRINRAKELLRTTNMKCSEIAHLCGYRDPHYFSTVFKKKSGVTPQQFRSQAQQMKSIG
jgi:two-component system response regulator YesN